MAQFLKYHKGLYNLDTTMELHQDGRWIWLGWPNANSTKIYFVDLDAAEIEEAFEFIVDQYRQGTQIIDLNKWAADRKETARQKVWEECNNADTEEAQ